MQSNRMWSSFDSLQDESERLGTFTGWQGLTAPIELAKSGFFYLKTRDYVQCIYCRMTLGDWEKEDNVPFEHSRYAPFCPLVRGIKPIGVDVAGRDTAENPRNSRFALLEQRLASFAGWPLSEVTTPQDLATSGFYYVGLSDYTRCFVSGCGLRNWCQGDDPLSLHKKFFPECEFVRLSGQTDTTGDQGLCKVCLDKELALTFIPCGHLVTCLECGLALEKCAICRKEITLRVRTFF